MMLVVAVLFGLAASADPACLQACDAAHPGGTKFTFCGNDHITYTTSWKAINDDVCYPLCGTQAAWSGTCGCPNRCGSYLAPAHGQCVSDVCQCTAGWTGPDCSSVACPANTCSGRGTCVAGTPDNGGDHCVCNEGYTAADCSMGRNTLSKAPWPLFPDANPYYKDDVYGDDHPLFNINVVAQLRFTISQADWDYLLVTETMYDQSYVSATFVFDNSNERIVTPEVGIRLKGGWSRAYMKKGFSVVFDKFGHDGRTFFGARKFGIKGNVDGDGITRGQLYADFNRAAMIPVQRASFAAVHINDIYMGVYWMHEDIDTRFTQSRLGSSTGDLWKFAGVSLSWEGDDPLYYQEQGYTVPMGVWQPAYENAEGVGDWVNLINHFYFIDRSSDQQFYDTVHNVLDIYLFRRVCVIETFMLAPDGYLQNGNNYYIYNDPTTNRWSMIPHDFDASLDPDYGLPTDIHEFLLTNADDYPLTRRTFTNLPLVEQFLENFATFLLGTFGPPAIANEAPATRYATLAAFVTPLLNQDEMWRLSTEGSTNYFRTKAQETTDYLPVRAAELWQQLEGKVNVEKLTGGKVNSTYVNHWFKHLAKAKPARVY